jgi:hypothetical protein
MRTMRTKVSIIITVVAAASFGISANNKPTVNGRTQSSTMGYCPAWSAVTVDEIKSDRWDSEYIHCKICGQGAILPAKDGILRCTYCGKAQKKNIAAN